MSSDDLFSDMDTIASKSSNYVDLCSSPVPQNACLPPPPQNNMLTPLRHEDTNNIDALNYLPNSEEMTNEDLSIIFDLDDHDAI